jgi:phage repressor protein C with HTH and peptisase S24 domain
MLQCEVKRRFRDFVKPGFSLDPMIKPEDLATVSGRLRSALQAAGKRQRDLATHFSVSEQAVSQWFRNESVPDMAKMFDLAKLLGVRAEWILHGTEPRTDPTTQAAAANSSGFVAKVPELTVPEINIQQWPRDVPILGGAACGEDGLFEFNGQTLDHARRPPRLLGVAGIYSLYIHGESMAPWREPGELVYVHPHQPVKIGDYVVVQMEPEGPGALPAAYIKKLQRRTAEKLVLAQFNPAEEKTLPMKKVRAIHRIMGWSELMGI